MFDDLFTSIFDNAISIEMSVYTFLITLFTALIVGVILVLSYIYHNRYTKNFVVNLAVLLATVSTVIMMVNGNLGTGIAIAGAFSLIRYRSLPGTAKEIGAIFLAMTAGFMVGMGYLAYAVLFTIIMCLAILIYEKIDLNKIVINDGFKTLKITIPESLNYSNVFDDILNASTNKWRLIQVKSTNLGSMFRLTYDIQLKAIIDEKAFIDQLRCRNGNLEISLADQETVQSEL